MRCYCCNDELTDAEATLRSSNTGQFLDMCSTCIKESGITPVSYSSNIDMTVFEETSMEFEDEEDSYN